VDVAQVIEFYVPARFEKRVTRVPHEQRGKVIAFRTDLMKSPLGPNISPRCTIGQKLLLAFIRPRCNAADGIRVRNSSLIVDPAISGHPV
jgi:hypothetical protein